MFASSANIATLQKRAFYLQQVRAFFSARGVWEADVPLLSAASVTDVNLEALHCQVGGHQAFLQTSPEFYLKRLLAMGSGDLFYLGKAFRQDESGPRHRPEFTLLEWYRCGLNTQQLSAEIIALIQHLQPEITVQYSSYRQLFIDRFGVNPHCATLAELTAVARQHYGVSWEDPERNTWLDLLFTHGIEPHMPAGLLVVTDYPASQCALARLGVNAQGESIAERFEVYWGGLELANGYWELTSAEEQATRFAADLKTRASLRKPLPPVDQHLLAALEAGIPDCAGGGHGHR